MLSLTFAIDSGKCTYRLLSRRRTKSSDSRMIPNKTCFTTAEWKLVQRLNTPAKVQRFFTSLPYNWERNGGTMRSFREVVKRKEAHCLEAAVAAAVILEQHGYPPLLLDLESQDLLDHVVFAFKEDGHWRS